jgi:hypothetical protein
MRSVPLHSFFQWLDHTSLSAVIRASTWGFAVSEMVHLLGLAILGGTILIMTLRALGVIMADEPLERIASGLARPFTAGLILMMSSGALMVADGPLRYYGNAAFRIKMALLAAAIAIGIPLHRSLCTPSGAGPARANLKLAIILSGLTWFGVALAGRLIGVL